MSSAANHPARAAARTPHILLVANSLEGGGAERVMSDMANFWAGKGWQVQLATWTGPEVADFYSLAPDIERVWLNVDTGQRAPFARMRRNVARVLKLRRLLKESRPAAVLSFIDVPNVLTILGSLGLPVRVVVSERNDLRRPNGQGEHVGAYPLSRPWRILRRLVYRWADGVTALHQDAAQWVCAECGVAAEVIPNPLRELPAASAEREALVLGVGRLKWEKGFDLLLRAFDRVAGDFPAWRLAILGEGPDHAALCALRGQLRSRDRIEIRPPVVDVENWMARAGLVVLPSRFEAYGNAILESLGMGAAVISTPCGGTPSFMKDGVNGRLVPVDDVDALARVMAELMADPAVRRLLGQRALKVRETNRQDLIMRRWEQCLFPDQAGSAPLPNRDGTAA